MAEDVRLSGYLMQHSENVFLLHFIPNQIVHTVRLYLQAQSSNCVVCGVTSGVGARGASDDRECTSLGLLAPNPVTPWSTAAEFVRESRVTY